MKNKSLLVFLILFIRAFAQAGTFDCQWIYSDFTTALQTNSKIYITPIAAYGVNGSTIITGDRLTRTNDGSGSLIVSNVVNGRSYRVEFVGRYLTTTITNSFDTNVTGFVNGSSSIYLTVPVRDTTTISYSQAASDLRFVSTNNLKNYVLRGTNMIFVTNASGSMTLHSTGGDVTQSGLAAGLATNVIYVAKNGSDTTGNGTITTPYLTISNGVFNATTGKSVFVFPGIYYNEFGCLKAGVNLHMEYGVVISNQQSTASTKIFLSDAGLGAVTNRITGGAKLWWSQTNTATPNSLRGGMLELTNASDMYFEFDEAQGESFAAAGEIPHLFYQNGGTLTLKFNRISCPNPSAILGGNPNVIGGVFWADGEFYQRGEIGSFPGYGMWNGFVSTSKKNAWITSDLLITGYIYGDAGSPSFKSWYLFKEMRRDAYGLTDDGFGMIGGRNYLNGMKISTFTNSAGTSIRASGSEVWATVQKIERNSTNSAEALFNPSWRRGRRPLGCDLT